MDYLFSKKTTLFSDFCNIPNKIKYNSLPLELRIQLYDMSKKNLNKGRAKLISSVINWEEEKETKRNYLAQKYSFLDLDLLFSLIFTTNEEKIAYFKNLSRSIAWFVEKQSIGIPILKYYHSSISLSDGRALKIILDLGIVDRTDLAKSIGVEDPHSKISDSDKIKAKIMAIERIIKKEKVKASSVIYFDDKKKIVESVRDIGVISIHSEGLSPIQLDDIITKKEKDFSSVNILLLDFDDTITLKKINVKEINKDSKYLIERYMGVDRNNKLYSRLLKLENLGVKIGIISFNFKDRIRTILQKFGWILQQHVFQITKYYNNEFRDRLYYIENCENEEYDKSVKDATLRMTYSVQKSLEKKSKFSGKNLALFVYHSGGLTIRNLYYSIKNKWFSGNGDVFLKEFLNYTPTNRTMSFSEVSEEDINKVRVELLRLYEENRVGGTVQISSETTHVASHYDKEIKEPSSEEVKTIRGFNNWIKITLINQIVRKYNKRGINVLDIAIGQGGDLGKWKGKGVQFLQGIDISSESIERAKKRLRERNQGYKYDLSAFDMTKPNDKIESNKFDLVSIQFALHYFFVSEKAAETLFSTISRALKKGGIFFGTTVSYKKLRKRLGDNLVFDNGGDSPLMKLEIDEDNKKRLDSKDKGFGIAYKFSLGNRVRNLEEYAVNSKTLKKIGKKYGMELLFLENSGEYFSKMKDINRRLTHKLIPRELKKEEKDSVEFYNVFAFEKIEK